MGPSTDGLSAALHEVPLMIIVDLLGRYVLTEFTEEFPLVPTNQ